jgi:cyclase
MSGYNLELISELSKNLQIPLIACGGASSIEDFKKAIEHGAHACAAGSVFVFHGPHRAVLISYPKYKDLLNISEEKDGI